MSGIAMATAAQGEANSGLTPESDTFEPIVAQGTTLAEIPAAFFPSDQLGIEYLFGSPLSDPAAVESPPVATPNPAANAMGSTLEDAGATVYSSHAGTPFSGPVLDEFNPNESADANPNGPAQSGGGQSIFGRVFAREVARLKDQLTIER